ncbi:MAG: pentapeptide repeat-containing protein [Paracoccus sp. (in: a-proteobacteria)]|uniref:pentapeptide repeat-containing protein n=1 Tax=Paracoccus sp. TaxID=267 RepID=UPI0039E64E8D
MDLLDWLMLRQALRWAVGQPFGVLVSVALLFLFVVALAAAAVLLLRTIWKPDGSLGAGALIVAILSAPFLIWNTVIRHRALEFQKEGHLTDRLAKAVEQVGAEKTVKMIVTDSEGKPLTRETTEPNLEVRMGGLLSLERIAQDSTAYDKGRDHVQVMEIICAYVRNNAPANMAKELSEERRVPVPIQQWYETVPEPRADIVLALTILERRSARQRRIEAAHGQAGIAEAEWVFDAPGPDLRDALEEGPRDPEAMLKVVGWPLKVNKYNGYRLDLRHTCLQRAVLDGFRLSGALLDGARLDWANLGAACLRGRSF